MAKSTHDSVADAGLDVIATGTQQHVCSAQPLTRAEAVTTYNLASVAMSAPDYTTANGDVSGRKVTVGAKAVVSITSTGTGNHVAITDGVNLLDVTTCTSQALTSGGAVDIPAWDHEIGDPT